MNAQRVRIMSLGTSEQQESPLDLLPAAKRKSYEEMIDLIYQCSLNRIAAKALVDRILERLNEIG